MIVTKKIVTLYSILNVKQFMKNILFVFLFCFVAMLYAAPPEATPAPPNEVEQITIQKAQDNSQILPNQFWRQSGKQSLNYINLPSLSAPNKPPLYRLSLADKAASTTKTLPSLPRYLWQYSKRLTQKTR